MVKLNCPYCSKNYTKAKHFENHIETKHRRTIDFLSVPEVDNERIEQEMVRVTIPKNPLDMTPDILMRLSLEEQWKWRLDIARYKQSQDLLNKIFAQFGVYQTTPSPTTSPEIDEKMKKLEKYEREESLRKAFQPLLDEMHELRQTTIGTGILDKIMKIESSLDLLYLSLNM